MSTSSSGTGPFNTCSSTDSSIDASHWQHYSSPSNIRLLTTDTAGTGIGRRHNTNTNLPRFAISPCERTGNANYPMTSGGLSLVRRVTVSSSSNTEELEISDRYLGASNSSVAELSPVDEAAVKGNCKSSEKLDLKVLMEKRPSNVVHELVGFIIRHPHKKIFLNKKLKRIY